MINLINKKIIYYFVEPLFILKYKILIPIWLDCGKQAAKPRTRKSLSVIAVEVFFIPKINRGGWFDIHIATRQFRQMAKKELIMAINVKDLKAAPPDHLIYNGKYQVYSVNSLEDYKKQREEKEGLKNIFLERIDTKKSREEMVQQLISALKKNGWKFKEGEK